MTKNELLWMLLDGMGGMALLTGAPMPSRDDAGHELEAMSRVAAGRGEAAAWSVFPVGRAEAAGIVAAPTRPG